MLYQLLLTSRMLWEQRRMTDKSRFVTPSEHNNGEREACGYYISTRPYMICTLENRHEGDHEEYRPTAVAPNNQATSPVIAVNSPAKELEQFEKDHGTRADLINKIFNAGDADMGQLHQNRLDWHSKLKKDILVWNRGYAAALAKHGIEEKP